MARCVVLNDHQSAITSSPWHNRVFLQRAPLAPHDRSKNCGNSAQAGILAVDRNMYLCILIVTPKESTHPYFNTLPTERILAFPPLEQRPVANAPLTPGYVDFGALLATAGKL